MISVMNLVICESTKQISFFIFTPKQKPFAYQFISTPQVFKILNMFEFLTAMYDQNFVLIMHCK